MNWDRTIPSRIPSPRASRPMHPVSARKSRAMVRGSIPSTPWTARAGCFCRSRKRLTYRMRNHSSRVTPQMATFIPSLRPVRSKVAPMSG